MADQDGPALTSCQKSKLKSEQIKMVLHLHSVKRVSSQQIKMILHLHPVKRVKWSQGRRWSCTYMLSK